MAISNQSPKRSLAFLSSVALPFISPAVIEAFNERGCDVQCESGMSFDRYTTLRGMKMHRLIRPFYDLWFVIRCIARRLEASLLWRGGAGDETIDIVTTNPWYLPLALTAVNRLRSSRTTLLILDLYPEALHVAGIWSPTSLPSQLVGWATRCALQRADRVLYLGETLRTHAENHYGRFPRHKDTLHDRSAVITIGPSESVPISTTSESRELAIIYSGNVGPLHDSVTLRRAIEVLEAKPIPGVTINFVVRGSHASALGVSQISSEFVHVYPPLAASEWSTLMASCCISLVTLAPGAEAVSFPSKVWSAFAAGHAVIAIAALTSDLAQLIITHKLGWVVAPGDVTELVHLLRVLAGDRSLIHATQARVKTYAQDHLAAPQLVEGWLHALGCRA